jgi:hypothetical protein
MDKIKQPSVAEILRKSKGVSVGDSLDRLLQKTPTGQVSSAIGDTFYGINHRQQPGALQINKDYFGYTFFTRPRLNLTSENLRAVRQMTPLLSTDKSSIQRIIRCLLDPELLATGIEANFVDNQQAFIPVLSNNLLSMSGWPDVVAPFSSSQEGMYKESFSLVDGLTQNYGTYDITANFRNIPGDPITLLFLTWIHYMSSVMQGLLMPYSDMVVNNEVDYNTRIYRLVMDQSKTRVQKIAACGAAFPTSAPIGAAFNFEADRPINAANDQISIHFQCMGAMYQDDILIYEFNKTVALHNDSMRAELFSDFAPNASSKVEPTHRTYQKIPMEALGIFNNRGYPRINPLSYNLEWWVSKEDFATNLPLYTEFKALKENNG